MAQGPHKITEEFERMLSEYTGAPYVVCVDNASNALYLSLLINEANGREIEIPCRTYPSVPCEIINAGAKVKFIENHTAVKGEYLTGSYQLGNTNIYDSALHFTANMYIKGTMMCLSFTGPYKQLKLTKGGAILLDNEYHYKLLKKLRFSGRNEVSYMEDNFNLTGHNFYMMPEIAARGIQMMSQFYDRSGNKIQNEPLSLPYPDLSQFDIYKHYFPRVSSMRYEPTVFKVRYHDCINNQFQIEEEKIFLNYEDAKTFAKKYNVKPQPIEVICSIEEKRK